METQRLEKIVKDIRDGKISPSAAVELLRNLPYEDLGFANIDHHRTLRKGFPEVIFGQSKTSEQILAIASRIIDASGRVLITRITAEKYAEIKKKLPGHRFNDVAGVLYAGKEPEEKDCPGVPVITAGTGDLAAAEEASETLRALGHPVIKIYDAGVAGIHRLFDQLDRIVESRVVIVAAGMDGVLPSVVGGLVHQPVIAVPTSCGYGVCFGGIGPLITMLNSCAPGVLVVNIDNGFGAGYAASMVNGS